MSARPFIWEAVLWGLLAAVFWGDFLAGSRAPFSDVLFRMFYPNAEFLKMAAARGEWPFWNPFLFSGVPFLANPQAGVLYPPTVLYLLASFPRALAADLWLHTVIAALGMRALARETGLGLGASRLAAFLYALNGFFIGRYAFPSNFHAYAWIPLALAFLDRAARGGALGDAAAAGAFFALQVLAGFPPFSFYALLAFALFLGFRRPSARGIARRPAVLGVFALVAAALSSALWVPAAALALDSPRAAGFSFVSATAYSESLRGGLGMLLMPLWRLYWSPGGDPYILGFYFGLPALALAGLGLPRSRAPLASEAEGRRGAAAALVLFGFLLALGRNLPGYAALYRLFPPFRIFRFPAQAFAMSCLGFPLLAAAGFERLRAKNRFLAPACAILCLADLFFFSKGWVRSIDPDFYRARPPVVNFLKSGLGGARIFMTPKTRADTRRAGKTELEAWLRLKDSLLPNLPMAFGVREAGGSEEMRYAAYDGVLDELSRSPFSPWMDRLAIKYILTLGTLPPGRFRLRREGDIRVYENMGAWPRAYFLADGRPAGVHRPLPARIVQDGIDKVEVEVSAPAEGRLVLADAYDRGWRAELNGRPVPMLKVNEVQRAVLVGKGASRVLFRYRPPGYPWAWFVSLAGWGAAALVFIY